MLVSMKLGGMRRNEAGPNGGGTLVAKPGPNQLFSVSAGRPAMTTPLQLYAAR